MVKQIRNECRRSVAPGSGLGIGRNTHFLQKRLIFFSLYGNNILSVQLAMNRMITIKLALLKRVKVRLTPSKDGSLYKIRTDDDELAERKWVNKIGQPKLFGLKKKFLIYYLR